MKFGQYLNENLTPEWKRAYIDYRACKKAIKVIARRLGQNPQAGDTSGDQEYKPGEEDGNDSSADEDYGPSAAPRKSPAATTNRGGRTAGSIAGSSKSPNPQSSMPVTSPSSTTPRRTGQSPKYGSMTTTPRPMQRIDSNPPPLDLGEPGSPTAPAVQSPGDELAEPIGPASADESIPQPKRGPVFRSSSTSGPGDLPSVTLTRTAASPELRSSEEGHGTDTSTAPLNEAGPSKVRVADKLRLSPKLNFSPRLSMGRSPRALGEQSSPKPGLRSVRSMTLPSPRGSSRQASRVADNFADLYDGLQIDEQAFFDLLARELEKVENFYIAREKEAIRRAEDLKDQLTVLAEHRKIYHELYPDGLTEWEVNLGRMMPAARGPVSLTHKAAQKIRAPFVRNDTWVDGQGKNDDAKTQPHMDGTKDGPMTGDFKALREAMIADKDHKTYSPERYTKYKKELRGASQDFYRQLERIKNYRIMNMTGFRKALKKFEKTTKVLCMDMWTEEFLGRQAFSNGEMVDHLIKQMEDLYTTHFEHGDSKKARDKLRRQDRNNTHYTTIFRSGFMIGVGLPATIFAIVQAMSTGIEEAIPAWNGLLIVYGSLYLPVIFAMLFELNLDAWVNARINYEFVMELSRPVLDFRSYLEIPSFLFASLSFCFYFTYFRVGESNIAPSSWPAIWLVMVAVLFLNPLPIFRRDARYWFLRVLMRVLTPGYSRVEFIAFFIADELNSLVYSIQNIYFLSCGYAKGWPGNIFDVCPAGKTWQYALLLCLPALARLIQCVKRWHDTRLKIHLINAGKYLSSISQFILFVVWRSRGSPYVHPVFFVWIFVAFVASSYTASWDLIVDWSLFRPGHKGLRPDRGYRNKQWYYCAMVYNVVIRFVWIWYLPYAGSHIRARSFFFALAEMIRRFIWNFFRVETEHLGNADAYRVTREIPLPYRRIEHDSDSDEPLQRTKSTSQTQGISLHLAKLRRRLEDPKAGQQADEAEVAPRAGYRQRAYEAWRPGQKPSAEV